MHEPPRLRTKLLGRRGFGTKDLLFIGNKIKHTHKKKLESLAGAVPPATTHYMQPGSARHPQGPFARDPGARA